MKRIFACLTALMVLACGCAGGKPAEELEIIFFDVGKADAFLFSCGGETMLMDAGTEKDGAEVAEELREMGVDNIGSIIITHFDSDHVGGAARIIREFGVKTAVQPSYMKESGETEEYLRAAEECGVEVITADGDLDMALGGAELKIRCAPRVYEKDMSNNSSLVTTVIHGDNALLFTGDIEKERISDWLVETSGEELRYGFLKVPHHGRYEKILPEFFKKVGAEYAVITSSNKHPEDPETLKALEKAGTGVYLTKNGKVRLVSDGKRLNITQ